MIKICQLADCEFNYLPLLGNVRVMIHEKFITNIFFTSHLQKNCNFYHSIAKKKMENNVIFYTMFG